MKILIIHGWGQSAEQYKFLIKESTHDIFIYEFPGFGGSSVKYTNRILYGFETDLREYLEVSKFDMIVACGVGCGILLKAVQKMDLVPRLVLINPICGNLSKFRPWTLLFGLLHLKGMRKRIDRKLNLDTIHANPDVLINSLHEIVEDMWNPVVLPKDTAIYRGENDELVKRFCVGDEVIPAMGHSALQYIRDIIMKEVFLWECSTDYRQS